MTYTTDTLAALIAETTAVMARMKSKTSAAYKQLGKCLTALRWAEGLLIDFTDTQMALADLARRHADLHTAAGLLAKGGREWSGSKMSDGLVSGTALTAKNLPCCPVCGGFQLSADSVALCAPDSIGHDESCPVPVLIAGVTWGGAA